MTGCESSRSSELGAMERLMGELSEVMPEDGVCATIIDRAGNSWTSHADAPLGLDSHEFMVEEIMSRIDDGQEPVIAFVNDTCIAARQVRPGLSNGGYAFLTLPRRSPETVSQDFDIIGLALGQIQLIASHCLQGTCPDQ